MFTLSAPGDRGAFLTISSNDPDFPAVEVKMTGFGVAAGAPRLSVRRSWSSVSLQYGGTGRPRSGTAQHRRRPTPDRHPRAGFRHGSPTFTLPAPPALPLPIPPGGSTTLPVQFAPVANGVVRSALTITPGSGQGQVVTLAGQGTTTAAGLVAVLFEQFGVGDPADALA